MTTTPPARTFSSDFKRFFIRGLVVLLPSVLTLWIVVKAYQFVDNTIARPINASVKTGLVRLTPTVELLSEKFEPTEEQVRSAYLNRFGQYPPPATERSPQREKVRRELRATNLGRWWDARWYMNLIGLVVAIVAVYVVGRLLGGFFGRRIYKKLEDFITTLPVFKQVYPYVKQVVDFLFSDERPMRFNRVVVVEYPRKGVWSVGFLTGDTMKSIAKHSGDSVTVFIPSSPTPFTGYTITVPRGEVREIPITVEEAIRFSVSGGVLVPERQLLPGAPPPSPAPILQGDDAMVASVPEEPKQSEPAPEAAVKSPGAGGRRRSSTAKSPTPARQAADTET